MSTQTNVMKAIASRAEDRGFDVVVDGDWGNTGTIYARHPNGLDAVADVLHYNFQPDYIIFDLGSTASVKVSWWRSGTTGTAKSLDDLVAAVVDLIAPEEGRPRVLGTPA